MPWVRVVFIVLGFFVSATAAPADNDWRARATPAAGDFPMVDSFRAAFRIGWLEIAAAKAEAKLTANATEVSVHAEGGSIGLARRLYQLDATLDAVVRVPGLETVRSEQLEKYRKRTLLTEVAGSNGRLSTRRGWIGDNLEWNPVKIFPARDLFAAMLFIRSQPLARGDKVGVVAFPGDSAFFVEIESLGTEPLALGDERRDTLKLDLRISRVNTKKGNSLEPHSKFRSGKIWLSNDADRIPLRAEVDIFIGYLFAEITSFEKLPQ